MANSFSKRREPLQFMLYLGILGSALLFFFVLFVFVRREFDNQDLRVPIPNSFWISTLAIILSSGTISGARYFFDNEKFNDYRLAISITFALGIVFLASQAWGWRELFNQNIRLDNDTAGSFVYILSGLHLAHTIGGILTLVVVLYDAFRNKTYVDSFVYSVNPPNQLRLKLTTIYWHFIDILWLILFVFLLYHAAQN
jgi:cytochrome c oxidase subunit 3